MSYPISRREQVLPIPALQTVTFPMGGADYIYFHTVPQGVSVKLNGESESSFLQGETHQGEPGGAAIQSITFVNNTAAPLSIRIVFGLGRMTVAGVATLSGAIPLPSGAATDARQDTGNASLASLTAANTDTPRLVTLGASSGATYTGCKSFALLNTGTGDVVVTANGIAGNLPPGYGVDFPLSKPLNLLAPITVATGGGGAALIALTT